MAYYFNSRLKVLARKLQSASLASIRSMSIHLHFVRLHLTAFWLFQQALPKKGCIWKYFEKGKKTIGKNEQLYCVNQKKPHL